jgi:GT2 family glycosyltransferase
MLGQQAVRTLVSVLMPCYRDAHLVERALPRILEGSNCDLEVVLLNNDSDQAGQIRGLVEALGDPRVHVFELEHQAGFAKAINAGIGATTGGLVFLANSDLFVADGYLDELVSFFARRPKAACATGKILRYDLDDDRETNILDTTGLTIGRNRRVADRGENAEDIGQFEREEEVFGVSGAGLVARRESLESIKVRGEYLDESFYMYKEDVDLCWRLRLAGWECWYVPSAAAYHGRTSHGLGRRSYLADMRRFHENEQTKPVLTRMNSMKNHWLVLLKNDDLANLARDLHRILGRETLIVCYNLVCTPRETARAVFQFLLSVPRALGKRREIMVRKKASPSQVRRWLTRESHAS